MTELVGHERPEAAFLAAAASGSLHHAWLLAGPRGIGKASFARRAASWLLAKAAGEAPGPGLGTPAGRTRALLDAGSHPDFKLLARDLKKEARTRREKEGDDSPPPETDLERHSKVYKWGARLPMFATTPSLSHRRVVVIDAIDDCEREAANALLKSLEEPPAGTIFLLVSHAPGRLLPTIRSRCRLLRFDPLDDDAMTRALAAHLPDAAPDEIAALTRAGGGAPGRALGYAGLNVAALDAALEAIAADGDPDNARRLKLSQELALKAAQPRYVAFLERAPAFLAEAAKRRHGPALRDALDAHEAARNVAEAARGLSLDPQATVFELAGFAARLAGSAAAR